MSVKLNFDKIEVLVEDLMEWDAQAFDDFNDKYGNPDRIRVKFWQKNAANETRTRLIQQRVRARWQATEQFLTTIEDDNTRKAVKVFYDYAGREAERRALKASNAALVRGMDENERIARAEMVWRGHLMREIEKAIGGTVEWEERAS